jgi:arylsulfatase A-like enzyme
MRSLVNSIRRIVSRLVSGLLAIGLLLAVVCLGGVAWIYLGSYGYEQIDDAARIASKLAYLERVAQSATTQQRRPNVILILFDDLGYGDLSSYGATAIRTPRIDALAAGGVRLTDYYSPAPVCSPSRAGLLTGRYPIRTRMTQVPMTPGGSTGAPLAGLPLYEIQRAFGVATRLPAEEIILPEVLQAAGYATGMFGKWHLGKESPSLPNERGFDRFEGLLNSNDQLPNPYLHGRAIVEPSPVDQTTLTERYTDAAIDFIAAHREHPFFLYMPHTFPHRPLYPSQTQHGKSDAGLYGDVVEDLDRSVGRIVDKLDEWNLSQDTLILITSDNGPWFQGSPGGHRGRKTDLFEGGFAVPFIAYLPAELPAGAVLSQMAMGIDVFPTVLALAGIELPNDRIVDGRDLMPMLRDGAPSPHDALFFYWAAKLGAVRAGAWKFQARRPISVGYAPVSLMLQMPLGPWLFDLRSDGEESYDVGARHPQIRDRLARLLEERARSDAIDVRGFH